MIKIERFAILILIPWIVYLSYMAISPPARAVTISMSTCRSQTSPYTGNPPNGFTPVGGAANNGTNNGIRFAITQVVCPAGQVMYGMNLFTNFTSGLTGSQAVFNGSYSIGYVIYCCSLVA